MIDKIAYIREAECIGCVKCIKACSDQAILGARKQMHTIITDLCTGCEDCVAVCPVDCIEMVAKPIIPSNPVIPNVVRDLPLQRTMLEIPHYVRDDRDDRDDKIIHNASIENKQDIIAQAVKRTLERRGWKNS